MIQQKDIIKHINIKKNHKDFKKVKDFINNYYENKNFQKLIEYLVYKDLGSDLFTNLNWIRKKYKFDLFNDFNKLEWYIKKYILKNLKENKEHNYNFITSLKNSITNNQLNFEKIKIFGFSQQSCKIVSKICNFNKVSKILIDDDLSTFTVSIPEINGDYDFKICLENGIHSKESRKQIIKQSMSELKDKIFSYQSNIFLFNLLEVDNDLTKEYIKSIFKENNTSSNKNMTDNSLNIVFMYGTSQNNKQIIELLKQKANIVIYLKKFKVKTKQDYRKISRVIEDFLEYRDDFIFYINNSYYLEIKDINNFNKRLEEIFE